MCDFCEKGKMFNNCNSNFNTINIAIKKYHIPVIEALAESIVNQTGDICGYYTEIPINYCPMCGKKLI